MVLVEKEHHTVFFMPCLSISQLFDVSISRHLDIFCSFFFVFYKNKIKKALSRLKNHTDEKITNTRHYNTKNKGLFKIERKSIYSQKEGETINANDDEIDASSFETGAPDGVFLTIFKPHL